MYECLKFIIKCITDFIKMLFTIDVGFTSLGMLMCICFLFFPVVLTFVNAIKFIITDELDERYDYERRFKPKYIGKHEPVVRHSRAYFRKRGM